MLGILVVAGSAAANPDSGNVAPGPTNVESSPPDSSESPPEPVADHRVLSAVGLAGTYTTLGTWAWFAWYYNKPRREHWTFGGDGWFGDETYAGGADKFGHFWANLTFGRLGTDLLRKGGWGKWSSSAIGSGMTLAFFFMVEVKDGFFYEFSPSDMAGNTVGALLAFAMSNWPELDDALDVRVQWWPSRQFQRHLSANFVEDYSGESYLFAYKPRSLRWVREGDWDVRWLEFVNPVIGFQSRDYKPAPDPMLDGTRDRRQEIFVGLTIDLQAVFDETLGDSRSRAGRWGHNVGHTVTEFVNAPFTTLDVDLASRSPDPVLITP
ncbi:MAG TPA: DUF2279 domain-containing protein [Kofleriaceae bacterium]|nr:DUF2279 domain-containing protein [Kofleriaceae bacterium]